MTTAVILIIIVLAATTIIAFLAASIYKRQRNDEKKAMTKTEEQLKISVSDAKVVQDAYNEFRRRAFEDQVTLEQRHEEVEQNKDEEIKVLWETINAKLDAASAAELSNRASELLQERRRHRGEGGTGASARETTVSLKKPS